MARRRSSKKASTSTEPPKADLTSAMKLFSTLMEGFEYKDSLDPDARPTQKMIYTNGVTLWMLILQRLGGGQSLDKVVTALVSQGSELLPDNKRVRENTLSENTSAYSKARSRLPLDFIHKFSERVCDYLGRNSPPILKGRRVFLLDGTTITLPPTPVLKKAFPPAINQHGESVWPIAQLMVAVEMQSGCALLPQVDPMYGPNNASEATQAQRIVKLLPEKSIVLADSGFGIFSVAYHTTEAGHDVMFRLTHSRFKALRRQAELIEEGQTHKSFHLIWKPSSKDSNANPDLPSDASIEVLLHEIQITPKETLYLVSTLEVDALTSANVYRSRYNIEFDIRDVKVTLDTENIRAKSLEMFYKELYTSFVAYNLITQFRRQAAKIARVEPRRLSFKRSWTTMQYRLLLQGPCSFDEWLDRYDEALYRCSLKKHPIRKKERSYARKAHPRRPKSTKFEKSQRQKTTSVQAKPPPLLSPK